MKTGDGTKNLARTIVDCNARRGVAPGDLSSIGAQQTIEKSISEYTPAKHRALIAMRCCVSKRPFNMVRDPHYIEEIHLLRPGTNIPSPATVSRDVNRVYTLGSKQVKEYFLVRCFQAC